MNTGLLYIQCSIQDGEASCGQQHVYCTCSNDPSCYNKIDMLAFCRQIYTRSILSKIKTCGRD